jgi:hypothetical protein
LNVRAAVEVATSDPNRPISRSGHCRTAEHLVARGIYSCDRLGPNAPTPADTRPAAENCQC